MIRGLAANPITILACSLLISAGAYAQQRSTCARTLELAQSVYDRGNLHKVPSLLKGCLTTKGKNGFTKQEKIEALKILTLSNIYREEAKAADSSMLDLLRTDHFFEINEDIDPKELILLYKTFRTSPLFSFGAKVGVHSVFPDIKKIFYVAGTNKQKKSGEYLPMIGIQVGINVEMPLFKRNTSKAKWSIAPELWYSNNIFSYQNTSLTQSEDKNGEDNSRIEATFTQQSVVLGAMVHYQIGKNPIVNPYVGLGANITYITSTDAQLETLTSSNNNIVNGPPIDFTPHTNPINFDLAASFGVKYKVREIIIVADIRYQYGLTNIPNKDSRTNTDAAINYGLEISDFTQNSIMLNLGFLIPYFSPKKNLK